MSTPHTPGRRAYRPREKLGRRRGEEKLLLGPCPAPAGPLRVRPDQPGLGAHPRPHGAVFVPDVTASLLTVPVREFPAALGFFNLRCF